MQKIVYKLIDLIDAGKLTDEHEKVFIRSAATLNSVSKDALHRHFNELYDRLRVYEDMYFDLHDKIEEISDAYDKDGESSVSMISTGVPVPLKLVTVTYAEDRLMHFEQERDRVRQEYETAVKERRNNEKPYLWTETELSDAGRTLQFYDDVVAMLKGETDTRAHGRWINCRDGNATCNVCGARQRGVCDDDNEQRYCGGCGAIMDGGTKCEND